MNSNSQRVVVCVKDSTAKLIMGLLVDVGIPFEYRREPGKTMSAVVSVAQRNGPTLLKVREVVEDRQERYHSAKASKPVPTAQEHAYTLPFGYALKQVADATGLTHWTWLEGAVTGPGYLTKHLAACAAWDRAYGRTPL